MRLGGGDRLLAIRSLAQGIALGREPRREDVAVGFVVVDDQNARRIVHDLAPRWDFKAAYSRILASSARGLKGFAT